MSVIGKITASYLLEKCPTYAEERRLLCPTSDQFEDKLNMGDTDECNNVIHKMTATYLLEKCPAYAERRLFWPTSDQFEDKLKICSLKLTDALSLNMFRLSSKDE